MPLGGGGGAGLAENGEARALYAGDAASVRDAAAAVRAFTTGQAGSRVTDAASPGFDLVTVFEALHDLGRPVDALAAFRSQLRPGGALLVLRAPTVRRWAAAAGFGRVDVLPVENPFWRFSRIG